MTRAWIATAALFAGLLLLPASQAQTPTAGAGQSTTSWELPDKTQLQLRANPVFYRDARYLIAAPDDTQRLYREAVDGVTSWKLDPKVDVKARSFAFVTTSGLMQIITKDAIASCNLENLGAPDTVATCSKVIKGTNTISIEPGERPAMGPDGSLYFRNVEASGRIVAYNPALEEIWQTKHIFTSVSPISLSKSGQFAYAVGHILDDFALVRIETASGQTSTTEIKHLTSDDEYYPALSELLQPAIKSQQDAGSGEDQPSTDYVFVSGNTDETGIFQLLAFQSDQPEPKVLWSRMGTVQQSETGTERKYSLTLFGDGPLSVHPFDGSTDESLEDLAESVSAGALVTDGTTPLFVVYTNQDIQSRLDEFAESLEQQDQKLDRELGEITKSLGEQDQKIDRELGEVQESLGEQERKIDEKLDSVAKSLDEQRGQLTELQEQIATLITADDPPNEEPNWIVWFLLIAAATIGISAGLAYWISTKTT